MMSSSRFDLLHATKRILITRGGGFNWGMSRTTSASSTCRASKCSRTAMEKLTDFLSCYRQ